MQNDHITDIKKIRALKSGRACDRELHVAQGTTKAGAMQGLWPAYDVGLKHPRYDIDEVAAGLRSRRWRKWQS